jgi:hypothetical protein
MSRAKKMSKKEIDALCDIIDEVRCQLPHPIRMTHTTPHYTMIMTFHAHRPPTLDGFTAHIPPVSDSQTLSFRGSNGVIVNRALS